MLAISGAHNLAAYVLPAKTGEAALVVYLKRPGGQAQYSAPLRAQERARPGLALRLPSEAEWESVADCHSPIGNFVESGALEHIHFQSQEVLCRHFFSEVDRRVRTWREANDQGGSAR